MPRQRSAPAPARSSSASSRPRPAASSSTQQAAPPPPRPAATSYSAPPPAPAPQHSAPPPAVQSSGGGGFLSGLMGSVVTGAAMGTGSAIAHRAVDSMMGPRETRVVHEHQGAPAAPAPMAPASTEGPCGQQVKAFAECMSRNNGDMGACSLYFDAMQQCKVQFPSA